MGYYEANVKNLGNGVKDIRMSDTWDLHPFRNRMPWEKSFTKHLRNLELGKALGIGKPFDVNFGSIVRENPNRSTVEILRHYKQGGLIKYK